MDNFNSVCLFTDNVIYTAEWLCDNLFFEKSNVSSSDSGVVIRNGNLILQLFEKDTESLNQAVLSSSKFGFAHIAMRTNDILAAIEYCKSRGMTLDLHNDSYYFNDGLWDEGAYYFNILTPFGYKIELCQRLKTDLPPQHLIDGLCHFGMCVDDFDACIDFFSTIGFYEDYHEIENVVNTNHIRCKTVARENFTFEVFCHGEESYASAEMKPYLKTFCLSGSAGLSTAAPTGELFSG